MMMSSLLMFCFFILLSITFSSYVSIPALPYSFSALEPFVDEATLRVHHGGHFTAYATKLNAAMDKILGVAPSLIPNDPTTLMKELDQVESALANEGVAQGDLLAIRNNLGGFVNHAFFWKCMAPNPAGEPGSPTGALLQKIQSQWGSFEAFHDVFTAQAMALFGSGWTWLVWDPKVSQLHILNLKDQDNPLREGLVPILVLDLWEHAYYLRHQNRRAAYIADFFRVVDWGFAESNLLAAYTKLEEAEL